MSDNSPAPRLRSKITKKKAVQWGKVLKIEKLYFNESLVRNFVETLKANKPKISEEEIEQEKKRMIMRDNFFNMAMDEVASAYTVEYDTAELAEKEEEFKKVHVNFTEEQVKNHAKITIFKQLIYDDLARDWEIVVSDDLAKHVLENYYKQTGKSIREYFTDPAKMSTVKESILEQLITERIMNAFGSHFDLQANSDNSTKS
ncbi:hypothetical protein B4U78_015805 [Microbacterium esteraromaticum]|uniref:Trigger factor C-terminal domain-containing protein n=1 Tax=Mycoplasma wenyonii TaxID=65123 RepID=A0A328PRY6_9MOLU|nr:hypothetical protein [Mycoplasma wenyonii]PYC99604.1 hypothetical protein B4U78_015805 [Microbacterium esteraromaticum]RAO95067.1 hypothetical protein DNK47_01785 [Mycoplasma wenyonii]